MNDVQRVFAPTLTAWILGLSLAGPVAAQRVERVIDIQPGPGSGSPAELTGMNGALYFTTYDGAVLWKSDGTEAGTQWVSPFYGPAGPPPGTPSEMVRVGNTLFVTGWTPATGVELWKSDGTTAGTVMVKDVCPGACGGPKNLTEVDGILYFVEDAGLGLELYRSDGTAAGTVLVKDILPGPGGSNPDFLTPFQGELFFAASDGGVPTLFKSDGTSGGTRRVTSGFPLSNPAELTVAGPRLYFAADEFPGGRNVWESDGTSASIITLAAGPGFDPQNLAAVGDELYFTSYNGVNYGVELFRRTPGEGLRSLAEIAPGPASSSPRDLVSFQGNLYFSADDGTTGRELWMVDTTDPDRSPSLVEDIAPGPASSNPRNFLDVNGTLFFTADGPDGAEMWRSDGRPGGSQLVHDIEAGPGPSNPSQYTAVDSPAGTNVFFTATTAADGNELRIMRNRRPVATAGPDVTIAHAESTTLDSAGSGDPDGDPIVFEWQAWTGPPIASTPTVLVSPSLTTTYTLTVRDGFGGVATDTVTVTVEGTPNVDLHLYVYGDQGGQGTVSVDPPGVICDNLAGTQTCAYSYSQGTPVTLVASPVGDSTFLGWSGACVGTGPCTIAMDDFKSVTAQFRGPQHLMVGVHGDQNGTGTIQITPPDQACTNTPGVSQYCSNSYRLGRVVTLEALPSPDSIFLGWMGGPCSGTSPTCQVTMDMSKLVDAMFRGPQHLMVGVHGDQNGTGTIQITPPNQACVNTPGVSQYCSNSYRVGTVVTLEALPSPDSIFLGWVGGPCSGTSPTCQVTMDMSKLVDAVFRGPQHLMVAVHSDQNGTGTIQITPPDQACVNTPGVSQYCPNSYRVGTVVTLEALPSPDSVFLGWVGGPCSGTSPTCQVTMDMSKLVDAVFRGPQHLMVAVHSDQDGTGTIQITPPDQACVNTPGVSQYCPNSYRVGTVVTLEALPSPDSVFLGWVGGPCSGTSPTCQVTMDMSKLVDAVFRGPQMLVVTLDSAEGGWGSVQITPPNAQCVNSPGTSQTCANQYRVGTTVQLDAIAAPDSVFIGWTSTLCAGPTPTCTVTIDEATNVTALFRGPQMLVVTLDSAEGGWGSVQITPPNAQCVNSPGTSETCANQYRIGTTVQLDATAAPDSVFIGWTSTLCAGPTPTCTVTVDEAKNVAALFRGPQILVVTVDSVEGGWGSVQITPPDAQCVNSPGTSQTCANQYRIGTTVQLDAIAAPDSVFIGWTSALCAGPTPTCTVTVDEAKNVAALFRGPQILVVTVDSVEGGWGSVQITPPNAQCVNSPGTSQTCANQYRVGTTVQLDAIAAPDSVFIGWTSALCAGPTPTCTVTIDEAKNVTAAFRGNHAPVAAPGGPHAALRNVVIAFDGTGSSDADGDPLTYAWDFGDGATATGSNPAHAYAAVGTYTVTLTVHDGRVSSAPATTTATITNLRPVAVIGGGSQTGVRGQVLAFDGSGSSDGDGDPLTYAWDFGDGSMGSGPATTHAYATLGTFTVTLVVSDGIDSSVPASVTVTIVNRPPVANAGGPYSGTRGAAVAFSGSATDADGDPLTYAWTFGDGATGTGPTPTHAYAAFGTFVATLVVNDGYADSAPVQAPVTIPDRPPVANAGGPYSGVRGQVITFNGSASADPDGNPLTYQWNFGDGSTGTGVNPTHVYTTVGSFVARLVVSDGGPQPSAESTAFVTIANRAPVANPGGPYTGRRTQAVQLNGSASTDADGDPMTYAWNFGDGSTGTGVSPTHLYTTLGTFTVTLTVHDGFTSSPAATTTVNITNVAPIANAGADRTVPRRSSVTLDGRASSDPDGTIAVWAWRQLSGPVVTLTAANTSQPRFTAPNVTSNTIMDFELKVTDNNGAIAIDVVRITVIK